MEAISQWISRPADQHSSIIRIVAVVAIIVCTLNLLIYAYISESRLRYIPSTTTAEEIVSNKNERSVDIKSLFWKQQLNEFLLNHSRLIQTEEDSDQFKIIKNENRIIRVQQPLYKDAQTLILLVSSMGRSGSSWVGSLLANSREGSMFVFEPLMLIQSYYKEKVREPTSLQILQEVFSCRFNDDYMAYWKKWPALFRKFPDNCKHKNCSRLTAVNKSCRLAKTIVVKTIRLRLASVEALLRLPSLQHLKVVYIARDPRAVLLSRSAVFRSAVASQPCWTVEDDVWSFHRLSQLFPGQLYFLRYEDMCRNPIGQATSLWRFLQTSATEPLPLTWRKFLTAHSKQNTVLKSAYGTFQDTNTQWYAWRSQLSEKAMNLTYVEEDCGNAMQKLGYLRLENKENVENLSLPFLMDVDCDFWNCWSYLFDRNS